ncbi:MAG: alpha/beta fold hydrolase [Planctomycetes bacterium]|nr:alpha/beta fold hydrolase [Planctomycetota bacterium]
MRIIAIHGIGDSPADFHRSWQDVLRDALGSDVQVLGLHWTDEQQRIARRFPVLSGRLTGLAGRFGVGLDDSLRDTAWFGLLQSHFHDVFTYCVLHDMRYFLQTEIMLRLRDLGAGREHETVIVAHSLGAALAVHVTQLEQRITGGIRYRGLVTIAPPLGIRSPIDAIQDPLAVTPDSDLPTNIHGGLDEHLGADRHTWAEPRDLGSLPDEATRLAILRQIGDNWLKIGDDALHFVVNTNDAICSDVRFELPGGPRDVILVKQGYSDQEKAMISEVARFHDVTFGAPKLEQVIDNHDAVTYLKQPATLAAIGSAFA